MTLRLFEYLAATKEMASTKVPGYDSLTSALIHALEALVEEKPEGRFTTVELLRKIKHDAPHFPKDQEPVLSDRKENTSAGRIMLHSLHKEGSMAPIPPVDNNSGESSDRKQVVTLQFKFDEKLSNAHLERLGDDFNVLFDRNALGVNRVRWGGMKSIGSGYERAVKGFQDRLERKRCDSSSMRQQPQMSPSVAVTPNGSLAPSIWRL